MTPTLYEQVLALLIERGPMTYKELYQGLGGRLPHASVDKGHAAGEIGRFLGEDGVQVAWFKGVRHHGGPRWPDWV